MESYYLVLAGPLESNVYPVQPSQTPEEYCWVGFLSMLQVDDRSSNMGAPKTQTYGMYVETGAVHRALKG